MQRRKLAVWARPALVPLLALLVAAQFVPARAAAPGTVAGWGKTVILAGALSDATAVAAGGFHNLALQGDGTVVAWGDNGDGQATVPAGLGGVSAIAACGDYSLAVVTADARVYLPLVGNEP